MASYIRKLMMNIVTKSGEKFKMHFGTNCIKNTKIKHRFTYVSEIF